MENRHLVERAMEAARGYEPAPPPEPVVEAAQGTRQARSGLDARVQRTLRSVQDSLARIDELRTAVRGYLDGLERLAAVQEQAGADDARRARDLEEALQALGMAWRRERRRRDGVLLAAGLALGVAAGAGAMLVAGPGAAPPAPAAEGAGRGAAPATEPESLRPPLQPAPSIPPSAPVPAPQTGAVPAAPGPARPVLPEPGATDTKPATPAPTGTGSATTEGEAAAPGQEATGAAGPTPEPGGPPAPEAPGVVMEVTGDGVRVRAGPGTEHGVVGVLSLGQRVTVTERAGGWARVEVPGRPTGWSASRYLTPAE